MIDVNIRCGLTGFILAIAVATPAFASDRSASFDIPEFARGINAGKVVTIADGDFVAESYASGQLAPAEAGYRDQLTALFLTEEQVQLAALEVSNSVTAPPEVLKLTPNGRLAFVVERLEQRRDGATGIRELAPGKRLFAIDLSDPEAVRVLDTQEVLPFPESVDVSVDLNGQGHYRVAVVANTPEGGMIQIADFDSTGFTGVQTFQLSRWLPDDAASVGLAATNVHWHPNGRILAVNLNRLNQVLFLKVNPEEGRLIVNPWGQPVEVGSDPFVGRFTPDGRYYLTSDWGRNFDATSLEGRLPLQPSGISVIRLAEIEEGAEAVSHQRIGGASSDLSAEGIAISPDGRLVATVNMRGTPFPGNSVRYTPQASVSLLTFDPETGTLSKIADYPFEGALPEGGSFDLSGDHFLATVFQYDSGDGGLEVFRVLRGESPSLKRLGRVSLPHGVHHVEVAP